MLQNILEQEDFIKGLPDASLYGEMEQPSGQLPQFLVLSEIQRRTEMRERYEATQEQPEGTISEQIVAEGLGGIPQEAPSMSPMGLASQTMGSPIPTDPASQASVVAATGAPPPPTGGMAIGASGLGGMGAPPQMTAGGGRVGYQEGGQEGDDTPAYYPIGQDAYGGRAILHLLKFLGVGGRETPREDADGWPPVLGEGRPIPELMQKYGSDYVMNFMEGEEKYSGEAKPRAVHDPYYQGAFEAAREEFYSYYPQSFIDDLNIARSGAIEEKVIEDVLGPYEAPSSYERRRDRREVQERLSQRKRDRYLRERDDPEYEFVSAVDYMREREGDETIEDWQRRIQGGAALEEDLSKIEEMASGGIIGMQGGGSLADKLAAARAELKKIRDFSYENVEKPTLLKTAGKLLERHPALSSPEERRASWEEPLSAGGERSGEYYPELEEEWAVREMEAEAEVERLEGLLEAEQLGEHRTSLAEDYESFGTGVEADVISDDVIPVMPGGAGREAGEVDITEALFGDGAEDDFSFSLSDTSPGLYSGVRAGTATDISGTDTAADTDSFQFEEVLNEVETAQELGGEELTSAYADISGAIGQDAADQRKLPGTLDRSGVTDALTALVERGAERLEARRGSTQELINQIREEGRRDAFSAAMMQLGAGVAGGDMSGGLQRAGEAATSINALARDAARAEGRGLRDYEEAALAQADEFGLKSATFEYEEERDEAIRAEEIRQWEDTYGLQAHVAETDRLLKEAAHGLSAAELRSLNVNRARTLEAAAEKIAFDITQEEGVDLRAATTSFENYMETIQEAAEDMGAAFLPEAKLEFIKANQLMILKALRPRLSDEFYSAFINALEGEGGGPPSATASLSDEKYRM